MKAKECPRCHGKGYLISVYHGQCIDGKRHIYTKPNGKRSNICLVCGNENPHPPPDKSG